jgi:hypothetical protein
MLGRSTSFRPRPIDINQKLAVYLGGDAQNIGNSPSLEAPSTPELGGGGTPRRRPRNVKPSLEPGDIEAAIEECNANDAAVPIKPQEVGIHPPCSINHFRFFLLRHFYILVTATLSYK